MQSACLASRRAILNKPHYSYSFSKGISQRRLLSTNSRFFQVSEEVQQALSEKRPVVALESTIYTHGYPYPDNEGGVPATIGVLDGVARVGLSADELIRLASSTANGTAALKVSRRDLGYALGLKDHNGRSYNGGTTVSATSVLAHLAGIKVFATGGLGGVHRGVEQTMDISADLTELGRTPIAVVAAGCKSFLDIPRTIEFLETQGVAVATFADGRTGNVEFPAFYSRESGVSSPMVVQNATEAARMIHAHNSLGLQSGMLFANPIPHEVEVPFERMEIAIKQALAEATEAGATGAKSTPYILAKIKEITGNESLVANSALIEANVTTGTSVAKALIDLEVQESSNFDTDIRPVEPSQHIVGPGSANFHRSGVSRGVARDLKGNAVASGVPQAAPEPTITPVTMQKPNIFVAGILAVDYACDHHPRANSASSLEMHTSNPARIAQSLGGVGHNVARAASLTGGTVRFCSAVGDDLSGKAAMEALSAEGLENSAVKVFNDSSRRTAQYVAVNEQNKDLAIAMADMSILDPATAGQTDVVAQAFKELWLPQLNQSRPTHLAIDANWPPEYFSRWLEAGSSINAHITFEPVSNAKSIIPFQMPAPSGHKQNSTLPAFPNASIHLATPNSYELAAMHSAASSRGFFERQDWWEVIDSLGIPSSGARTAMSLATSPSLVDAGIPQQSVQLLPFIPSICTKLGAQGVLVTQLLKAGDPRLTSGAHAPFILSRCTNGTEDSLGVGGVYMRLFPPVEEVAPEDVVSVNGVGDSFVGTLVSRLAKAKAEGKEVGVEECVDVAQRAAVLSLKSKEAVSPMLESLNDEVN
ncbi:hypothetical protein Q7P37_003300 [Cladosporium fusiforme]